MTRRLGIPHEKTLERRMAVRDAVQRGENPADLHTEFGIKRCTVSHDKRWLVDNGYLEAFEAYPGRLGMAYNFGDLRTSLMKASPEVKAWALQNAGKGVTVADFVVACVTDAYHEEDER